MRVLCFADLPLPLDGPAGRDLARTCDELAHRGHQVTMVVRPDGRVPARDPFTTHGIDPSASLRFEPLPLSRGAQSSRAALLALVAERALQRDADAIYTRDPGIAARVLGTRRVLRPRLLYDSPGYGPDIAATLPNPPDEASIRALERRERLVWQEADAYIGRNVELIADMTRRFGRRRFATVVTSEDIARGHLAGRIESLVLQVLSR